MVLRRGVPLRRFIAPSIPRLGPPERPRVYPNSASHKSQSKSWSYVVSANEAERLLSGIPVDRPILSKPHFADKKEGRAKIKRFLDKNRGASPQDLHRIHRSRGFSKSIRACGKNWQKALGILRTMGEGRIGQDVYAYTAAINVCGQAGAWGEVVGLLQDMDLRGIDRNDVVVTAAITAAGRCGKADEALQFLRVTEKTGLPLPIAAFNATLAALARARKWRDALQVFESLDEHGLVPDAFTFASTMNACARGGRWNEALQLFEMATGCGVKYNVVLFNTAISACAGAGEWERALWLLKQMKVHSVKPDVISLNSCIDACADGGKIEKAKELLASFSSYGITPNAVSFGPILSALEKEGNFGAAVHLLEHMEGLGIKPDDICLGAVIGCASSESAVQELLDRLQLLGVQLNAVTYSAAIKALEALDLSAMPSNGTQLSQRLIDDARRCGYFSKAWPNPWPDTSAILSRSHIGISRSDRLRMDLHECSGPVARGILRKVIREFDEGVICPTELHVITGQGNSRKNANYLPEANRHESRWKQGAVLPTATRSLIKEIGGPEITEIPRNPGCFIITKAALEKWLSEK